MYMMNMKCILVVVNLLFGVFAAGNGTVTNPEQEYAKQGTEAILQCKIEDARLIWKKQNLNDDWTLIATQNIFPDNISTKYNVSVNPITGLYYRLHVLDTQPGDELIYYCDGGPERKYYIQLNLYMPPKGLYFHGLTNNKLNGTEGTDLLIKCIAEGGKPPPDISIIDGTMSKGIQEVSYIIPRITRNYHLKSIECQANSNALDSVLTETVQIYLYLKPLTPIFEQDQISTVETDTLKVSCISYGSLPAATFTWTIAGNDVTPNSTISQTKTESNDTITVTSSLKSSVNRSHNNETITCKASNPVGSASAEKTLDVKYAPDITVNNFPYDQNDANRTVTCNPSGNPNSYTYNKWQHKSKYGEIIREFVGSKTLKLPEVPVLSRYQDSGEYVCTASNGIKDKDNIFEQKGSKYVTIKAQPVFTSDNINRVKQFGEIDKAVDIYVNVYSVPKFQEPIWAHDGKTIVSQNSAKYVSSSSPTIVKDKIHGKEVRLNGYNVTLTIRDLKKEDLTNYTVTLVNGFENVIYTIILESASVPETPGNFTRIASSTTSITVQWEPNSDGGYTQTFYIQYRVQGLLDWTTVPAGEEDANKPKRTYEVTNLQEGKAYELRMYAENRAMKRSNVTDMLIAFTDAGSEPSVAAIVGGIAGCLIAIIIVLLVILYVQKKRKENGTPSTKLRACSESEEEDGLKDNILYESSQSDGVKKNILNQLAGPDFESQKTSTSSEYAVVQKPNVIYAEVNKEAQPKNAKEKKQKDKKGKPKKARKEKTEAMNNNPEEEYANSALPLRNLNDGEYANSTDSQGPSDHHTNAQGLEYADLTFGQISAQNKKQVIHGNDERTIYADVDHTKKVPPPPPESEYEETNIKHGKMA